MRLSLTHIRKQSTSEEAERWPYAIRGYGSYDEMIKANAGLPEADRLDYVIIVTPNNVHYDPVMKAMKAGIQAAAEVDGVVRISAGNYGGKLGRHKMALRGLL